MLDGDLLQSLGLSSQETKVYLAALELGRSLPKHLAEKANIKRPTLYKLLPELLEKGFLSETIIGKRRYLIAEDPQVFLDKKQSEIGQLEKILPQFRSLLATASIKPKINFYEGLEGLKKVYMDNLRARRPIAEFIGLEKVHPEIESYLTNYYISERIRRRISIKILISGPPKYGTINLITDPRVFREIKTISGKQFPIPLDCYIYGDNVSFLVFKKDSEPIGVIIRSKEISVTMKSFFDFIWGAVE